MSESKREINVPEALQDPEKRKVLLIEDDHVIAEEIVSALDNRGFCVKHVNNGDAGLEAALNDEVDVMIIDRMLPSVDGVGIEGLSIIEKMHQQGIYTPVLVLSALSAVDDRIDGLKAGGDDYLTKPFVVEELLLRLEALLRRPSDTRETRLCVGPLEMDLVERRTWCNGNEITLLPREFRLLTYFMRRPGQVLTRAMLLEDVWQYRFIPRTNLVDVHVGRLRRKIDLPGQESFIQSVRGVGFQLRVSD
ncbi:MAG: response regulator transcription factor [Acetobacter sp.]|nr:response regulator transcription factor [Acetobacter sp.]